MRKTAKLALSSVIVLSVICFSFYAYLIYWAMSPGPSLKDIDVVIERGSNGDQIARQLHLAGVVNSSFLFYAYLRFATQKSGSLKSGYYQLPAQITPKEVVRYLDTGLQKQFRFMIPEGSCQHEIIDIIANSGLASKEALEKAISNPILLEEIGVDPNVLGGAEGYLFPETYQFQAGTLPIDIFRTMHQELLAQLTPEIQERIKEKKTNLHEVLTLASLIEKETSSKKERPIIASVFLNRLKKNMKLQTDPTVIYGQTKEKKKIKKKDLKVDHLYNTYLYKGLPPGPISSPGIASIRAVLWPAQTNFLYFVSKNNGTHEFCTHYACHVKAINRWLKKPKKKKK